MEGKIRGKRGRMNGGGDKGKRRMEGEIRGKEEG